MVVDCQSLKDWEEMVSVSGDLLPAGVPTFRLCGRDLRLIVILQTFLLLY